MKQGVSREDAARSVRLERGSLGVAKETVRAAGWESFVVNQELNVPFTQTPYPGAVVVLKSPPLA
jgi:hypothetical protein